METNHNATNHCIAPFIGYTFKCELSSMLCLVISWSVEDQPNIIFCIRRVFNHRSLPPHPPQIVCMSPRPIINKVSMIFGNCNQECRERCIVIKHPLVVTLFSPCQLSNSSLALYIKLHVPRFLQIWCRLIMITGFWGKTPPCVCDSWL